jgi:hypothetical protein
MAAPDRHLSGVHPGMIMNGEFILSVYIAQTGCLMQLFANYPAFFYILLQLLIVFVASLYATLAHYGRPTFKAEKIFFFSLYILNNCYGRFQFGFID